METFLLLVILVIVLKVEGITCHLYSQENVYTRNGWESQRSVLSHCTGKLYYTVITRVLLLPQGEKEVFNHLRAGFVFVD